MKIASQVPNPPVAALSYGAALISTRCNNYMRMWIHFVSGSTRIFFIVSLSIIYPMCVIQNNWFWEWHHGWVGIFRVLNGFIIGCLLFNFQHQTFGIKGIFNADTTFLLLTSVFLTVLVFGLPMYFVYPIIPFLILTLANSRGLVFQIFGNQLMIFLGTISFSIYMVHYPILEIYLVMLNKFFLGLDPSTEQTTLWIYLFLMVSSVIRVASASYYLLENPIRKFLRGRILGIKRIRLLLRST